MNFEHRAVTRDDAAAAAAVITAYESSFVEEPDRPNERDVLDWWEQSLDDGSTVVTDNGRLVGIGIVRARGDTYEADNFVHPDFAGRGIGSFLLDQAERRARKDSVRILRAVTLGRDARGRELFERRGFRYIRSFYRMMIDLTAAPPPPSWPAGFTVAPLAAGEERQLYETVQEAFAEHWGHVRRTFEEWMAGHRLEPELCFLVREGDNVVAAVISQEERFGVAWVDVLGVRAPWRRKGLGEALLRLAFGKLYERGGRRVGLGVDAENTTGATRLYERVGMHVASQADVFEKRLDPAEPVGGGAAIKLVDSMGDSRVDVSIERKQPESDGTGRRDPNTCPSCESHYRDDELAAALRVCPQCGHHFPMPAWERIASITDEGSFEEEAADLRSADPLDFFDLRPYRERLAEAELATGLGEAIVVGTARLDGHPCALAVMDFSFMGGSMGSAVGEKFARACEAAADLRVPLVSVTASGGARMQEGILSLMQLPKTVCAVEDLHDAGSPIFSVMAHPTTAGVLASFASLGDVILAEPGALLAFTGPRVVQQTTRERLPEDFGQAESNYRFGHVDAIVPRPELRSYLGRLVRLFRS
jgi:acetyl-CoA carboxylase carboxyl transferase subunit beta